MAHSQDNDMEVVVEQPSTPGSLQSSQKVDIAEALEVRREYRRLISEVQNNREQLVKPDCEDLLDHVRTANTLYKRVRRPQEAMLDARFMSLSMPIAQQKVNNLPSALVEFKPEEFIAKLLTKMGARYIGDNDDETAISPQTWQSFGRDVTKYFRSVTPAASVMSGTFDVKPKIKTPNVTRNGRKSDEENSWTTVKPQALTRIANHGEEASASEIERVYAIIKKHQKENPCPLDFFRLVVNPNSYGHTIENIFHLSFLVTDDWVRITIDESDPSSPKVSLVDLDREKADGGAIRGCNQVMVSLSMAEWQEIVELYDLNGKIPLIKPVDGLDRIGLGKRVDDPEVE